MLNDEKRKAESSDDVAKIDHRAEIILQISFDGFCAVSLEGKILEVNQTLCDITGYSKEELLEMGIKELEINETSEQIAEHIEKVKKQGHDCFETQHKHKSGKILDIEVSTRFCDFGEDKFFYAFFRDITERKKMEEKIVRVKEEWERTFNSVPDLVAIIDRDHRIVRVNKAMSDRMGIVPDDAVGMICYECIHGTNEPPAFCPYTMLLADGQEHTAEFYEERLGGYFIVSCSPMHDDNGSLSGCVHVVRDITERKKDEEALRESENRYKALLQDAAEGILVADIETKEFKYANPAICKMLGYTEEEMKRMGVHDIHPKEDLQHIIPEFEAQARGEKILTSGIPCLRKDGTIMYADIKTGKVMIDGKECNMSFFTDITKRKRIRGELENYKEKVFQAQKHAYISSIGTIVAHQLNQPLTAINMRLGKALEMVEESNCSPKCLKNVKESMAEAKRAASIIRKFRQYFRGTVLETTGRVKVSGIAKRIISILSERAKQAKINIFPKNLGDLPKVEINETALEQILYIIIQNAIEASDGQKSHKLDITGKFTDGFVELQFSDDCCGITPENLDKIFEPFFSTKSDGKGIGLGLDIVQQILISCGGEIRVESKLGKGATFYVTLPISNNVKS